MGNAFAHRLNDELGTSFEDMARAYTIARDLFCVRDLWKDIEALDNQVPDEVQMKMMVEVRRLIKHITLWLLNSKLALTDIQSLIERYRAEVSMLSENVDNYLSAEERQLLDQRTQFYRDYKVPAKLVRRVVILKALFACPDITWLKDKSLTDLDNLPDPDVLATEIIENLQSGIESFQEIMLTLSER